jgi:hypothetical protein
MLYLSLKVSFLYLLVFPIRIVCGLREIRSIGKENTDALRKTCPNATLPTTNLTWTDPGLAPGLHDNRSTTDLEL